jgi:short-subunit dehydrogenase
MRRIGIITGASSGLGSEFCRQLANPERGDGQLDELFLIARRHDRLTELAAELAPKKVRLIELDLSQAESLTALELLLTAEKTAALANNDDFIIDTLVNNAGFGTYGPFAETGRDWQLSMIDLNCRALTGICHLCLPYFTKGSRIINVASLAAFMPLGNFAVYAASKSYVLSFSVALAAELLDRGVSVSALCPGSVDTEFAKVASGGAREKVLGGKSPARVVRHCLKKSSARRGRGKAVIVMAPKWKFNALLSRLVGRYLVARFTYKHHRRPQANKV